RIGLGVGVLALGSGRLQLRFVCQMGVLTRLALLGVALRGVGLDGSQLVVALLVGAALGVVESGLCLALGGVARRVGRLHRLLVLLLGLGFGRAAIGLGLGLR